MFDQTATAVLDAPEFAGVQQTGLQARTDADRAPFDPFDMFDVEPADQGFETCEFGTA